ncbi:MAG: hypothetical protein ACKOFU_04780 [Actinomycetota bacterium]
MRRLFLPVFFFVMGGAIFLSENFYTSTGPVVEESVMTSTGVEERDYPEWMEEFIEPPADVDPKMVYTFLCEYPTRDADLFTTACADFGEMVRDITWNEWGAEGATGKGIYSVNDCEPSCAEGKRDEIPVRVWLEDVTTDGMYYYLNTLKIVPIEAFEGSKAYQENSNFNLYVEVVVDGVAYEGAVWDVARDWKMNSHLRSALPSEK